MTSAFVVQVGSQLQPDPNEETAALLRVLIHKIDNTTFGGNVPSIPEWLGPPRTIVRVEAILYASLAASLISAFLAMLGKQWLNRYASIDMRGSTIERSQNRQRKLDNIVTWYFDHVMGSLPLILQFALLLLGCALSLYLRGIDKTVASVVLGATLLGVVFYTFIVIAGTASVSCPYQTPSAHILRHTWGVLRSASSPIVNSSVFVRQFTVVWAEMIYGDWIEASFKLIVCSVITPLGLAIDIYHLVRAMARVFVAFAGRVASWFRGARKFGPQAAVLDLQCISWVLQTSLDKAVHLSTLRSLATMTTLGDFNPVLVSACFDILTGCVVVLHDQVIVSQGLEELAEASALCLLHTFSHLTIMDPTSSVLKNIRQRYIRTFPLWANFVGFPSCLNFAMIHHILYSHLPAQLLGHGSDFWGIQWEDHELPSDNQVVHARALAKLARSEYQKRGRDHKVPRWILRFALHHLSQDPLPPTSVVADCLSVIAIDLGYTVSNETVDERYVRV